MNNLGLASGSLISHVQNQNHNDINKQPKERAKKDSSYINNIDKSQVLSYKATVTQTHTATHPQLIDN